MDHVTLISLLEQRVHKSAGCWIRCFTIQNGDVGEGSTDDTVGL